MSNFLLPNWESTHSKWWRGWVDGKTRPHRTQRLDWTRNFSERAKTLPFITSRRYRRRKVFFFLFLLLFHPPPSFSHFPTTPTGAGVKCLAGFYFPLRRPNNIFGCLVCVCMLCEPFLLYDGHLFTTPHLLPPPLSLCFLGTSFR